MLSQQHSNQPAQSAQNSHTTIVLSTGERATVPEGADPDAYHRYCEARIKLAANPKPRRRAYVRSSKPSKRVNYAERVLAAASPFYAGMQATARRMDELAAIADDASEYPRGYEDTFAGGIEWDIPFMGEPVVYESEADDYGLQPAW